MIDADGIERPDDTFAHTLEMPHRGKLKRITKKSQLRKKGVIYRFFCYLLRIFVWAVLSVIYFFSFHLKVEGKKNKREMKKRVVVVGNHCHVIDVTLFSIKFMPRMMYITSIQENFQIPVLGGLIKMLGAVPIPTDLGGMRLFNEVIGELLKEEKAVAFLPEGALWHHYRDLRPFKKGAFSYAVKNNAPVLPAVTTIRIVHKSLKKKKYRLKLSYLPAIYPDSSLPEAEAIEKLKQETHAAMKEKIDSERGNDIFCRKYRRQMEKQGRATRND